MEQAASILELLTKKNPTVIQDDPESKGKKRSKSMSNTSNIDYRPPTIVKKWEEMQNLDILRAVFDGKLFEEAHREGRDLYCFKPRPSDCLVSDEKKAGELFNKWNKEIVMAALDPILDTFHPVIWAQGRRPTGVILNEPPSQPTKKRNQPERRSTSKAAKKASKSVNKWEPDSGSIPSHPKSPDEEGKESFIKEYKVAAKWKSRWIRERGLVDESGLWRKDVRNATAWPVMQTYSYCIEYMCRYGCIITCEEAFIFRVRPLGENPGSEDPKLIRKGLSNNGLLEYISIPWDSHGEDGPKVCTEWTVNLALWFVHVLAGNMADIKWTYQNLEEETALFWASLNQRDKSVASARRITKKTDGKYTKADTQLAAGTKISEDSLVLGNSPSAKRKRWREEPKGKVTEKSQATEREEETETECNTEYEDDGEETERAEEESDEEADRIYRSFSGGTKRQLVSF